MTTPVPVRLAGRTLKETRHICAFFHSKEEQNKVLMPFFKEGFERGEKLFHVVPGGRNVRILVVDDNEDAADMLVEALASAGYRVRTANDGPAALRVAAEFKPHIALLDIGLPVMDGYELAERLQQLPELAGGTTVRRDWVCSRSGSQTIHRGRVRRAFRQTSRCRRTRDGPSRRRRTQ